MEILLNDVVDSTQSRDEREVLSRLFVVYDGETGNVVHVHSCVGDAQFVADDAHSRTALQMAKNSDEVKDLRVLPVPAELGVQGEVALHVDVSSGQIIVTKAASPSLRDLEGVITKHSK